MKLSEQKVLEKCTNVCAPEHEISQIKVPAREIEDISSLSCVSLDSVDFETVVHTYERPESSHPLSDKMDEDSLIRNKINGEDCTKPLKAHSAQS